MSRNTELKNMARMAGLEVLRIYQKHSSTHADVRAPNGNETTFFVLTKQGSGRDDQDCLARMKRFARQNPAPVAEPAAAPEPAKPRRTITVRKHADTARTIAEPAADMTNASHERIVAPEPVATRELTTKEILRLSHWLMGTVMTQVPSLEALSVMATKFIGQPVSEGTMREVMEATETAEPEHWHALPDQNVIILNELALLFQSLGHKPSRNFERLLETVKA